MERLKSAVQGALTKRSLSIALKKEQMECVSSIVDGRDVLAVLPTGYGKSLIFQLLPDIYDHLLHVEDSVVLVISPLNALMHDQIAKLSERGISACMIQRHGVMVYGKEDDFIQLPLEQLANPKFQLIYMHPEVCVHERKVISFFNSSIYQERVRCVVVDEAHLVLNWYVLHDFLSPCALMPYTNFLIMK